MRTIMVINAKGGCGKTTIATNLAGYFAWEREQRVAIADFDPQLSSLDWLKQRPEEYPEIIGIDASDGSYHTPHNVDVVILDVPAAVHGKTLTSLVRRAESLIIPVLPSPIDMRACAHFIEELLLVGKVNRDQVKLAVVANRVKENTIIFHTLEKFLRRLKIPRIGTLRDTQNYIRAAERGLSIFELAPSMVAHDLEQWQSITRWVNSKRSRVE